jgi:hypothetical protein
MRLIHTADWHLGRTLHGASLIEDQAHLLAQFVELARNEKPDAVVIAGDVYDRAVPPTDAVRLLNDVLDQLILDLKLSVVMIAGNHDAADRLAFASRVLQGQGLHILGQPVSSTVAVVLEDKAGPVHLYPLPYAEPAIVRHCMDRQELQGHQARYSTVGRLAEVATGSNSLRITFQRFVLGTLLDDVLVAASERLKTMSRGRYLMQRCRDSADRRRAAGLDLEVEDFYTGQARPVSTLSGGEGFLAALSLALGLADVVQSYAGGIRLDTIFIDEGFGSLDDEALDDAMRALIDLRETGRLVGVISHVNDMKQQIDTRLEITKGKAGSAARFVLA